MDKSPGDAKYTPQMPEFRGDKGESGAKDPGESEKTIHYER